VPRWAGRGHPRPCRPTVPVQIKSRGPGGGPNQFPTEEQTHGDSRAGAHSGPARFLSLSRTKARCPRAGAGRGGVHRRRVLGSVRGLTAGTTRPARSDGNTAFPERQRALARGRNRHRRTTGTARPTVRIVGEVFQPSSQPTLLRRRGHCPGWSLRQTWRVGRGAAAWRFNAAGYGPGRLNGPWGFPAVRGGATTKHKGGKF